MNTHVVGKPCQRIGRLPHEGWGLSLSPQPRLRRPGGVAQGARGITHCRSRTVSNDVGHLRRAVTTVDAVDMLDDFLSSTRLNIDVNVRRARSSIREETLEEKVVAHGIDRRDSQAVAHG